MWIAWVRAHLFLVLMNILHGRKPSKQVQKLTTPINLTANPGLAHKFVAKANSSSSTRVAGVIPEELTRRATHGQCGHRSQRVKSCFCAIRCDEVTDVVQSSAACAWLRAQTKKRTKKGPSILKQAPVLAVTTAYSKYCTYALRERFNALRHRRVLSLLISRSRACCNSARAVNTERVDGDCGPSQVASDPCEESLERSFA